MNITLTEILSEGVAEDGSKSWIRFKKAKGDIVIFWGSPEEGTRNIDAVKYQKLPVSIEIDSPEDCEASQYEKSKYKTSISIPEYTWIQIIPDL